MKKILMLFSFYMLLFASCGTVVEETFIVTFDSLGGTEITPQNVSSGGIVSQPIEPLRNGYDFAGWYSDMLLTIAWDFETDEVTRDMTLYAKWIEVLDFGSSYTVTFDSNGGTVVGSMGTDYEILHIDEPIAPTKDGFIFAGWYSDMLLTIAWDFETDEVTRDMTLYAKWIEVLDFGSSYTVTFDSNGGTVVGSMGTDYEILHIDEPIAPTKDGFIFAGWYSDMLLTIAWDFETDEVTRDMTLYAKWIEAFSPQFSNTIESDEAVFYITLNYAEINSTQEIITVTVTITAKSEVDRELYTSAYGEEGIIEIRIIKIENEDDFLYSEFYDTPYTEDILTVHLSSNDTLTRLIQFARNPFHGGFGGDLPSPIGNYKIQVRLFSPEGVWIDTGITISLID